MRFKDPVTNKKRYRPQKIWIHSLSRWINIWIVCPRCNWSGLKTYYVLSSTRASTRRQWRPRGLRKRQLSAHQRTLGRAGSQSWGFGPVGLQAGDGSPASPGAIGGSSTLTEPWGTAHQARSPAAGGKPKEVCLREHQMALSGKNFRETTASSFPVALRQPSQLHLPPTAALPQGL